MSHCVGNLVSEHTVVLSLPFSSWVWQSPKLHTWHETVQSNFWKKNMTVQIFTKKNNVWFINFSCMCQRTCFWLSNHKPVQSAPVCVKNRTWYYRGISKRPVKIKGFREVLCSSLSYCQHFFGICCLMWLVKNVSYLRATRHVSTHARMTGRELGKARLILGARQGHLYISTLRTST